MNFPTFKRARVLACSLLVLVCLPMAFPSVGNAAAGDEHWDPRFGLTGVSNAVFGLMADGGEVYAGGFSTLNTSTNSFDVWNGQSWKSIPGTFSGGICVVYAVAKLGSDIYVGGIFSRINGVAIRNLARWNGTSWSEVGGGVIGGVFSLAVNGTDLYVGGTFTNVGGVTVTNIARWDGGNWHPLAEGISPYSNSGSTGVRRLAFRDGLLYVAGAFSSAGNVPAQNVAVWNGSTWSALGAGVNGIVYGMALTPSDLYLGGDFMMAGTTNATRVARWDGTVWSALGTGLNNSVNAIGVLSNRVYVGGSFTNAGGIYAPSLACWDGNSWSAVGRGANDAVFEIIPQGSTLLFGGLFNQVDTLPANHVARFDGNNWSALGNQGRDQGAALFTRSVHSANGRVYLGGLFTGVGGTRAGRIASWDGTNWSPLGSGLKGTNEGTGTAANVIAANGSDVYVGGVFTNAGGVSANSIARWNGNSWSALGSGVNGSVSAIAFLGSDVYVGGNFTTAGGLTAFNIAKWNGASWSALPGPFAGTINNFFVSALAVSGSDLYVGGSFFAGGNATNIARFSGGQWFPLGPSVNDRVLAIAINGSNIYVGGRFTAAGLLGANRIAKWDGANWTALGSGIGGSGTPLVNSIALIGSNVYAGGTFTNVGGFYANRLAKWDGQNWSSLGSGVVIQPGNASVTTLSASGNDLYAAGSFHGTGGKAANFVGHWNEQIDFVPLVQLSQPEKLGSGAFRFRVSANAVPAYVIESTTNFSVWIQLLTNTASLLDFTNHEVSEIPTRFYRARSQ
jgi:hypothetical protein